ncbi:hypothetical protein JCM19037_1228 [Geomicrobium sp. JCM 19037]|uniref:hypothetical protein n=1 Tax=Geomicrobium sp. JCM 19037 TaxID=1460634 RepID=UPI00045F1AA9|nr:hypothetical protein [Geomicrobium sp. JCM 19037]GAK02957.1 hypothetical protein JCM19037_1228 [Geomicrobium sp. JCM 19037]
MSKLKEALREAMDKDRTLAQSLAKVAGYSNPTPIYKFVNHPAREFQSFATLLKVTEVHSRIVFSNLWKRTYLLWT